MNIVSARVYCKNCDKTDVAQLLVSYNTFQPVDPDFINRLLNNIYCPVCGEKREIVD